MAGDLVKHEPFPLICGGRESLTVHGKEHLGHQPRQPLVPVDQALGVVDRLAQRRCLLPQRRVRVLTECTGLRTGQRRGQQAGIADPETGSSDLAQHVLELQVSGQLLSEAVQQIGILGGRAVEQFVEHGRTPIGCYPAHDREYRDFVHRPVLPSRLFPQGLCVLGVEPDHKSHIEMISCCQGSWKRSATVTPERINLYEDERAGF